MVDNAGRTASRRSRGAVSGAAAHLLPPPSARRVRALWCFLGAAGLILVVVGSFLPWVVSGNVRRSSYAVVGVLGRLGIADGSALGVLITLWPLVGVLCMAPVVASCVRLWRTAGVLGVLVGLASAALSFGVLIVATGRVGLSMRLDPIGPAVMAAGAVLLIGAGAALALRLGSPVRRL